MDHVLLYHAMPRRAQLSQGSLVTSHQRLRSAAVSASAPRPAEPGPPGGQRDRWWALTAASLLQTLVTKAPSGARKTPGRAGATKRTAPGFLALASGRAPAADGLPVAVDPSTASFRALALQVRAMGLLDRRPDYYRVKITLTIFAFLAGWALFVIVGNSWTTLAVAALVGMMFTQLGFIGHDAGHNQVFRTRRRNRLLGLTVGNALIGLSFGWWVPKHNAHHAHPNERGRDPDIGEGVALASSAAPGNGPGPLASWLARWQAPLFFPLMLLRSVGMHVLGIRRLLQRRDRASAVEACLGMLRTPRCT